MKINCSQCGYTQSNASKFCAECGSRLVAAPMKKNYVAGFFLFLFGIGLFWGLGNIEQNKVLNSESSPASMITPKERQVKLLSVNYVDSSDMYFRLVGEVQNLSSEKMSGVSAVATIYDKQNQVMATDSFSIEYNPLMPDQVSPFTCIFRKNPLMDSYKISFKNSSGQIETIDARKKSK